MFQRKRGKHVIPPVVSARFAVLEKMVSLIIVFTIQSFVDEHALLPYSCLYMKLVAHDSE